MKYLTKQRCIRLLALLLTAVMVFCAIPMVAYAEEWRSAEASATSDASDTSASASNAEGSTVTTDTPSDIDLPIVEVVELREESVKHFRLPDGTYVAAQYPSPVHVQDENGAWVDIDNALTEDGTDIQNANARIKFSKKITGNERLYTLKDGDYQLTLSLRGAIKRTEGVAQSFSDAEEDTELQKMMYLEKLRSRVLYADILDGVDIEYIVNSLNIKENILVKERLDSYTFSFELKLKGLAATLDASGNVLLTDASTETVVYRIPAPVVHDASGVYAPSDAAYYTLTDSGNGKYTLTVTVSDTWMNDDERVYPVTVDPTVTTEYPSDTNNDLYVSSAYPSTSYDSTYYLYVSSTAYTYWKPTEGLLSSIPDGAYISGAYLDLYLDECTPPISVGAYAVISNWDQSLTWEKVHNSTGTAGAIEELPMDVQTIQGLGEGWYTRCRWDITEAIGKKYRGETCYGISLRPVGSHAANAQAIFLSANGAVAYNQEAYKPCMTVTYASAMGTESYFPTITHSAGRAGTGSVNLATGNLTFTIDTLTTTDYLMPMTLSWVYNSALAGKQHRDRYTSPYQSSHMPYGFQMNVQQTVYIEYIDGVSMCKRAVYIDGDGTEHYFEQAEYLGDYYDRSGQGRTMDYYYSYLVIRHRDGTTLMFSPMTESEYGFVSSWYLSRIEDANGNNIIIGVNGEYMPTEIALQPCGVSDPIPMLSILYYNNIPYAVVNEATKEGVIFRYSSTYNGSINATAYQYLRTVLLVHGSASVENDNWLACYQNGQATNITVDRTLTYAYDENAYLRLVRDDYTNAQDIGVQYMFTKHAITGITELARDNTTGQLVLVSYGARHTDVHTSGGDDQLTANGENEDILTDDILTRYRFDAYGRAASSYSTAIDGHTLYGATAGVYAEQEAAKNNLAQVVSGRDPVNYLTNGSFEESLRGFTYTGTVTVISSWTNAEGQKAVQLAPTSTQAATLSQWIALHNGTYTLSMLIRTENCADTTLTARLTSQDGETVYASQEFALRESSDGLYYASVRLPVDALASSVVSKLTLEAATTATDTTPIIKFDCLMLENQAADTGFSLIEYGGFEATSRRNNAAYAVSNIWQGGQGTHSYEQTTPTFGQSLKVNAGGEVYQTVFEASEFALDSFDDSYGSNVTGAQYILSGFGMADSAIASGGFALRADVHYYQGVGSADIVKSYYVSFDANDDGAWQYAIGLVPTTYTPQEGEAGHFICVREIRIYCDFTDQVSGTTAYFDNIAFVRTAGSNADEQVYNDDGLPIKSIDADGTTTYYKYDSNDQVTRIVNDRGELVDITYDTTHTSRVMEQTVYTYTFNSSYMSSYPYDAANPDAQITKTKKTKTSYTYNAYGQCTGTTVTQYADDGVTITGTVTTSVAYVTSSTSPFIGQTIYEIDENGNETHYFYYNDTGRLMAVVDPTGQALYYTYDEVGRLICVQPASYWQSGIPAPLPNEEEVTYTYDAYDRLSTIATRTTTYTFAYNSYDAVSSVSIGSTAVVSYTYNANNGKLNALTYANGYTEDYVYDDLDRLTEIWYTQGSGTRTLAYSYVYTADGALASFTDHRTDQQTVYQYDISGRLTHVATLEDDAYVLKTDYIYDELSQLSTRRHTVFNTWNSGTVTATVSLAYQYVYKEDGAPEQSVITSGDGTVHSTVSYTYDDFGRVTGTSMLASDTGVKLAVVYTYRTEDDLSTGSQISKYQTTINGASVNTYSYRYDANGNITRITNRTIGGVEYTYDNLGQLTWEWCAPISAEFTYTYDNAGNLTKITKQNTSTAEMQTVTLSYTNTAWGDQLTRCNGTRITYDSLGNPLSYYNGSASYAFVWDGRNLLYAVPDYSYGYSASFTYLDNGMRASKEFDGTTTQYYYEGERLVAELRNTCAIIYLYDEMALPIGMMYRAATTTATWQIFWYEKNLQGDVVAVYDNNGVKQVSYLYDAWGNTTTIYHNGGASTGAYYNPFRYRSYYYDSDLRMYWLQTRLYDPAIRRFISPDDISYLGANGDLNSYNLYAYCSNNPVNMIDPTGHSIIATILIGALVGGLLGGLTAYNKDESLDDFWTGFITGAVIGAVVVGILSSGNVSMIFHGVLSVGKQAATDFVGSKVDPTHTIYWEDYVTSFVNGSFESAISKCSPVLGDVYKALVGPAVQQLVKTGTRGQPFDENQYVGSIFLWAVLRGIKEMR